MIPDWIKDENLFFEDLRGKILVEKVLAATTTLQHALSIKGHAT